MIRLPVSARSSAAKPGNIKKQRILDPELRSLSADCLAVLDVFSTLGFDFRSELKPSNSSYGTLIPFNHIAGSAPNGVGGQVGTNREVRDQSTEVSNTDEKHSEEENHMGSQVFLDLVVDNFKNDGERNANDAECSFRQAKHQLDSHCQELVSGLSFTDHGTSQLEHTG